LTSTFELYLSVLNIHPLMEKEDRSKMLSNFNADEY